MSEQRYNFGPVYLHCNILVRIINNYCVECLYFRDCIFKFVSYSFIMVYKKFQFLVRLWANNKLAIPSTIERLRYPGFGVRVRVAWFWLAIFSSMSVPLLVIKVRIFRIISLSIARKQKKYDGIIQTSSVKQDDTTRTRTPKPGYLNLSNATFACCASVMILEMPEIDSKGQLECTSMLLSAQCLLFPSATRLFSRCMQSATADLCLKRAPHCISHNITWNF
jgi:hypothetical protein